MANRLMTLPIDSEARKDLPMAGGCRDYFPAALAGVARWSKIGNDKHNPGQPLHHARGKSMDHEECIERHSMDLADLQAAFLRGGFDPPEGSEIPGSDPDSWRVERQRLIGLMLDEYDARAWRALAASQEFREKHGLAPLAPAARLPAPNPATWILAGAVGKGPGYCSCGDPNCGGGASGAHRQ